jgi:hypothetical protein
MPTVLELAGIPKPDHVEFNSLLPLIEKRQNRSSYDAIYGAYLHLQRMIEADGYKLIVYPKANRMRLFHVESDPFEMTDLAEDKRFRPRILQLSKILQRVQKETGDPLSMVGILP